MSTAYRIPVEQNFAWQQPVLKIQDAPPASPTKGQRYIVGTGSGTWTGHDKAVAVCTATGTPGTWEFNAPSEGWKAYNLNIQKNYEYNGSAWIIEDVTSKMELVTGATENNLASFDGSGQVKDSGYAIVYDADFNAFVITSAT